MAIKPLPLRIDINKFNSPRFHVLFWIGYFVVAFSIFVVFLDIEFAVIRVLVTGVSHMLLAYTVLLIFIPKFFMKGLYLLHYALAGLMIALTSVIRVYVDSFLDGPAGVIPIELFSPLHYTGKALSGLIVVGICHSLKFIQFSWQQHKAQQELEKSKLEAELKLLKAQVNPHFLFNTLNNIYSLAYTNGKDSADMILKLSDLMRYMIYESDEKWVPLQKEVNYLTNYIDLQKLKKSKEQNIKFEVKGDVESVQVAPMLFIPFFENAFKHGEINSTGGYLESTLSSENNSVVFHIKNSVPAAEAKKDKVGGIGLENIKKRLELLYPGRYQLEINGNDHFFEVSLKIGNR